jgi:sirohydrochlorin ferrochelatase
MLQFYYENPILFSPLAVQDSSRKYENQLRCSFRCFDISRFRDEKRCLTSGFVMIDDYSGALVIGHGMREAAGVAAFMEIVEDARRLLPETPVEGAFLEFARPTIGEGLARLASQGATHVAVVPMLLSALGHTLDDVPKAVAQAADEGSDFKVQGPGGQAFLPAAKSAVHGSGFRVQDSRVRGQPPEGLIRILPHVGAHGRVVELSTLRYREALEGKSEISPDETLLIIAAHGSPEPEAIKELAEFAARREKLTPVGRVEPCFAVLGEPKLADVLKQYVTAPYKRIVVQTHLLLKGRYHDMICQQVEQCRRERPDIDWIVTAPLGPHSLLAQAAVETVRA